MVPCMTITLPLSAFSSWLEGVPGTEKCSARTWIDQLSHVLRIKFMSCPRHFGKVIEPHVIQLATNIICNQGRKWRLKDDKQTFRNNVLVRQVLPCYPPTYNLSPCWSLLFPHVHLGLLLSLTRLGDTGLEVLHEAHHILHLGFIMAADHKKNHGCSLQRHIDASWGGTQNILDQQPYLITNEPLVLLNKCITMNSISRSSCNAFLARRSHIQLVCQPGYQHCDETTSRSPLILR